MKSSLFLRVFLGYLLVIIMLSGMSLLAFSGAFVELYRRTLTENLTNIASALKDEAAASIGSPDGRGRLEGQVKRLGGQLRTRITIIDPAGTVLADSENDPARMENHASRPEVQEALKGRKGVSTRFSSTMNQEVLYVALPLEKDGRLTGIVRTSLFVKDIKLPGNLLRNIGVMWAVFSLLALVVAVIVSRSVSRPIRELTLAAQRLASGDFGARVFLKGNDEFRALADTFNSTSRRLKSAFDELGRQKAELKSIIDSLREGLVVINKKGEVIYCNESLKSILGAPSGIEGQLYWEALGQSRFIEILERARGGKISPVEEVEIDGRMFLCSAARIDHEDEIVLVLHDITSMREIEKIKRDLVSSVSHELRTPLTSIKGFAETLEEEVDEKSRHYVEIIKRNTDRLINIVRDLLLLSQLEEKATGLEIEEVDLRGLAERTIRIFEHQAKQKDLELTLDCAEGLPPVMADPFKIEQMLINLLDNAIKYTDRGSVTLSVRQAGARVTVEVRDTGIGMPKDKLSRIFERFYVIDKSRSRKTGGTGLGLSIVKHIVLLHGGDIEVESAPGRGSSFLVTLPLSPPE